MRSIKRFITVPLMILILLVSLCACGNAAGGEGDISKPETEPPDTAPTIVASPSLDSIDAVGEIGIQTSNIILEGVRTLGDGRVYDGRNQMGRPLWKASNAEDWAVKPNVAIPDGFPTLVVPVGTDISLINHTENEVISDYYVDFSSGESYALSELPPRAGVYIRVVTVEVPVPSLYDSEPEIGAFFGEYLYFFVVSFE